MESSRVPAEHTDVDPTDEDKRLIMQVEVQNMFKKESEEPTNIILTYNCKQLPPKINDHLENNRLCEIVQRMDPNFYQRHDFELTKDKRELVNKDLMGEICKSKPSMTTGYKEKAVNDSHEVSSLASEDGKALRTLIESTVNNTSKTLLNEPYSNKKDGDIRYKPQKDNPSKDDTENHPKQKQTNAECNASIYDLPTRRNSRVTSLEKEEITVNDNDSLSRPSVFDLENELICLERGLPCSFSKENRTVNNAGNHANKGDENFTQFVEVKTEEVQSARKTVIDSNNGKCSYPVCEYSQEKNTAGSSADQVLEIDNLITILKKAKDLLSGFPSLQTTEQTSTSKDNKKECPFLDKVLTQKKDHNKKHGSKHSHRKKFTWERRYQTDVVSINPDCPGDSQVSSKTASSEKENEIEKEILSIKRDLCKIRESVERLERESAYREDRVGYEPIGNQVMQDVKDQKHETRGVLVDLKSEANDGVPSVGTAKEKINHGKRSAVDEFNVEDQKVCKKQCKSDCRKILPMDYRNGPFFIDRDLVPVAEYYEGLREKRWNPTQVLYQLASMCEWSPPEFTECSTDDGFLFSVRMENWTFTPIKRGRRKQEAKHEASTFFLNFLGFEFVYIDPKADGWKGPTGVPKHMSRKHMRMQQLVDEGRVPPKLNSSLTVNSSEMLEYCKGDSPNMSRPCEQYSQEGGRGGSQIYMYDQECNRDDDRKNNVNLERQDFIRQGTEHTSKRDGLESLKRGRSPSCDRSSQSKKKCLKSFDSILPVSRGSPRGSYHDIKSYRRTRSQSPVPYMHHRSPKTGTVMSPAMNHTDINKSALVASSPQSHECVSGINAELLQKLSCPLAHSSPTRPLIVYDRTIWSADTVDNTVG